MRSDPNTASVDQARRPVILQTESTPDPGPFSVSLQVVSHAESRGQYSRFRNPDMAGFPTLSEARTPELPSIEGVRVRVEGKFFRLGESKFTAKGVTYGPFVAGPDGEPVPPRDQVVLDLHQIRQLGANVIRVYHVPPRWFLNLALEQGIRVFVDVPWNKHLCFLDDAAAREAALRAVREAAERCSGHPAVFALSVVNEIPADIVRWSGARAVSDFVDALIAQAKAVDAGILCTFGNFPTTEFLRPRLADFECWNVYLHHQRPFENYLARLQMLADARPLVIGEFGIDSLREGAESQAEILAWQIESAFRGGCAGAFCFAFTDEWYKNNEPVTGWAFGLVRKDRTPKPAFEAVRRQFELAPRFPLVRTPRVSVVIASYNGAATLRSCLHSLERLRYPDFEVILVDDGSTDATQSIAAEYPSVRYFRHAMNQGLGVARNTGITAATGEIIAFTDSDCRADEDWLHYVVGDLLNSPFAGIGGHNLMPPDSAATAACVLVSPGGPAHVMLNDRIAEHIPGCNMAFYKWALDSIGGFDPIYRRAGDDVDICWRLQQRGYRIGFSPAGFVWHYRRNTVQAYLKQQAGYGEAEALLERRHPENFNRFGGSIWHGRIYSNAKFGLQTRAPIIYHGLFGSAFFQSIYTERPSLGAILTTTLEFHVLVTLPLLVLGSVVPTLRAFGAASALFSIAVCCLAAAQAEIPAVQLRWWSRPLVALLFFLQPIVRGWARHQGQLSEHQRTLSDHETLDSLSLEGKEDHLGQLLYWSEQGLDRMQFLGRILERLDQRSWPNRPDAGWSDYDIELYGSRWASLQVTTVGEWYPGRREMIRCRLVARWSFLGRALFWSAAGLQVVIIGAVGHWGAWGLLTTLPLLVWWLNGEKRHLTRVAANFLDELAKEFHLIKVTTSQMAKARAQASEPGTQPLAD